MTKSFGDPPPTGGRTLREQVEALAREVKSDAENRKFSIGYASAMSSVASRLRDILNSSKEEA